MGDAFVPPRALVKVCRSETWRRKRVWRGTRDCSQSFVINGGWGEAWQRAGRARWMRVRREVGRSMFVCVGR